MALMLAALAHDFGKVAATTESGGVIHAYGHEEAGLPPAEDFLRRVIGEKATPPVREKSGGPAHAAPTPWH